MGDHKFEGEHKGSSISEIKDKVTSDSASNNEDKVKVGVATKDGQLGFLFTREVFGRVRVEKALV